MAGKVWLRCALGVAGVMMLLPGVADADMTMIRPNAIKWADAPPVLPKGAKIAVLMGDPNKPGPYIMRLKAPANYRIAPHTHTLDENITVLSGTLVLGMSEKIDKASEHVLPAGGFHALPGKTPHYAYMKGPTVVQVHGEGPFDLNYLNPSDNPDTSAKK